MKIKLFLFVAALLLSIPHSCLSDTLYLKNGSIINSDTVWQENGFYQYTMYGATIGISENEVQKVEYSPKSQTRGNDFQFDIWPFGVTTNEAIDIAEKNDVPLHRSGIISVNKHFHPKVRKYSNASHFYYNTNLLGHFAKVELYFTPVSKKLHTVKIQWPNQRTKDSKLANEIVSMISEKHGKPQKKGKRLFYSDTQWIAEHDNQIEMNISSTAIFLSYLHTNLRQVDHTESEHLKTQKIKSGAAKDKNKF